MDFVGVRSDGKAMAPPLPYATATLLLIWVFGRVLAPSAAMSTASAFAVSPSAVNKHISVTVFSDLA
jgi:hypothetical protein